VQRAETVTRPRGRPKNPATPADPKLRRRRKTPVRKTDLVAKYISYIENFSRLDDETEVPLGAICALRGISLPTAFRMQKAGLLPASRMSGAAARIQVGEYRRLRARIEAMPQEQVAAALRATREPGSR
jgi:hypothetical protein